MICGPLEKGIRFAFDVGIPEHVVSDTGHANGTRMRDYGGFGDPASPKNALLVECGQHWEQSSRAIAIETMYRFLHAAGLADEPVFARLLRSLCESLPCRCVGDVARDLLPLRRTLSVEEAFQIDRIAKRGKCEVPLQWAPQSLFTSRTDSLRHTANALSRYAIGIVFTLNEYESPRARVLKIQF